MNLEPFIAKANAIFLEEWEGLQAIAGPGVTQTTLLAWLLQVKHVCYMQRRRAEGTAYYQEQKIWYNPYYITNETNEDLILDLVLHELGHLFTYHFAKFEGHGWMWQQVGATVGYMWRARLSDSQRRVYLAAAKRERVLRSMKRKLEQLAA